jgi:hypothetical protein
MARVKQTQELWQVLVSACDPPDARQLALWVNRFDDAIIEKALWRASRKFSAEKGRFLAEVIYRYVTGVCLNEERERSQGAGVGAE